MSKPLIEVKDLKIHFPMKNNILFNKEKRFVKAVDGISFVIHENETLGLVGESGCGKSTTGKSLLRLIEPTAGEVIFEGKDITKISTREMRDVYRNMQLIFQDPYASLNPRKTVGKLIEEPLLINSDLSPKDRLDRVYELLDVVGLNAYHANRYPHEFSGGQRQRVGIARALALNPKLIIADEAVSALDVSIQSQILNLLRKLQQSFGLTYLFISHDLSVVKHISDRIAVMYLGEIVELGTKIGLYDKPLHPYTQALLSAAPSIKSTNRRERIVLEGDMPSPVSPPSGCKFHTRCFAKMPECELVRPQMRDMGDGHYVACHLYK
ncbi:ABC transporter ATP-binding protein [Psychrobacillus soli]|uniref:Dipeptide ABC transporter ATP-binding protein n=1 Tax=Psychrobacillus soli TaxID=1543965 RepID=A0A544TLP4_9BACI|nr:dipeptide ABC transporter ATP-binding protein [Psychrobacillus soli]TQR18320.1 dipeptide ABC transporter ATP-binding protein [Psychrobacillus soli]